MTARILAIYDDIHASHQARYVLQCANYDVPAPATSVDAAISLARNVQPDLVLLDMASKGEKDPLVTARDIVSKLNVPVLCLTEYDNLDCLEQWQAPELIEFLFKPYEEWELLAAIKMTLNRHAACRRRMDE